MNINDPRHPWSRLTAAARRVPQQENAAAPYGFSTRIAALAGVTEQKRISMYERFAFRAVAAAGLLAAFSVVANFRTMKVEPETVEIILEEYDPVAVLMDG
jgi:hypothetical protein